MLLIKQANLFLVGGQQTHVKHFPSLTRQEKKIVRKSCTVSDGGTTRHIWHSKLRDNRCGVVGAAKKMLHECKVAQRCRAAAQSRDVECTTPTVSHMKRLFHWMYNTPSSKFFLKQTSEPFSYNFCVVTRVSHAKLCWDPSVLVDYAINSLQKTLVVHIAFSPALTHLTLKSDKSLQLMKRDRAMRDRSLDRKVQQRTKHGGATEQHAVGKRILKLPHCNFLHNIHNTQKTVLHA